MPIKPEDLAKLQELLKEGDAIVKGADRWRSLAEAPRQSATISCFHIDFVMQPRAHSGGDVRKASFRLELLNQEPEAKPAKARLMAWAMLGRMLLEADEYRRREIVGQLIAAGVEVPADLAKPL